MGKIVEKGQACEIPGSRGGNKMIAFWYIAPHSLGE
jgi:hypothetical protein